MIQWTDAPLTAHVDGVDLTAVTDIHLTFVQNEIEIDYTTETGLTVLGANDLSLTIDQERTGGLRAGIPVLAQLNFINANNKRRATTQTKIPVGSNLLRRLIPDE